MPTAFRIIGTILILLGALIALKLGFSAISTIGQPFRLALSALLFFFTAYAFMRLANRIWGKNLFSSGAS
jgi:hypothetical protein